MSFQDYSESAKSRLHLGSMNKKALAGGLAVLAVALAVVAFNVFDAQQADAFSVQKDAPDVAAATVEAAEPDVPDQICVHVGGCVVSPGVVMLDEGSRVGEAVAAAGGMTADALPDGLNLARILEDGEQVIVQSADAAQAQATQASQSAEHGAALAGDAVQGGVVNINKASVSDLQTLSGIGQSKAQKIVDYRDSSGPFKSVDDLVNVSGIGEKTLESIRSRICV